MGIHEELGHSSGGAGRMVERTAAALLLKSISLLVGRTDPLNFSAIMEGTNQKFTKLRYEDLFSEGFVYEDFNSGQSSKNDFIQQLQQIQIQDSLIEVEWIKGDIWKSGGNDTMILSGLRYYIFPDGNLSGMPADSGISNFTVVYNRDWLISQWSDVPSRSGKSFFAPP